MKCRIVQVSLFLLLIGAFCAAASARSDVRYTVQIPCGDTEGLIRVLEREGFDVAGRDSGRGMVSAVVSVSGLRRLRAMGLDPRIVNSSAEAVPPGYEDFEALLARMQALADSYPDLARSVDVGAEYGVGSTFEGRPLMALKISDNVNRDEDEPSVLIVSGHHAREIVTPVLAVRIMEKLLAGYGKDRLITRIVDRNEIWIAPVWNPDGYAHVFGADSFWRRNRSPLGFGQCGVDLNRNYPFGWNGPAGGSTDPAVETFRGRFAASEKETQNMLAFAADRHFAKVLDFHSHGREVIYTYHDPRSMPWLIENWYRAKAVELSARMGYGGVIRKPSAEGEHYQWQLNENGAFSVLVETSDAFHPPYSEAIGEAERIWPGACWFLDHEIPLKGHVTETVTGRPIEADISVAGLDYPAGDRHGSGGPFGRYHHFLPPGEQIVTFSAPGYAPRTVEVLVEESRSAVIETQLGTGPALTVAGAVLPGEKLSLHFDYPAGAGRGFKSSITLSDGDPARTGRSTWKGLIFGCSGTLDCRGQAKGILVLPDDPELIGRTISLSYSISGRTGSASSAVSSVVTLTVGE